MQEIQFEIKHTAAALPADRRPPGPSIEQQCRARCKATAARASGWIESGAGTSIKLYHPEGMRDPSFWEAQVKPQLVAAGYVVDESDAQYIEISVPE